MYHRPHLCQGGAMMNMVPSFNKHIWEEIREKTVRQNKLKRKKMKKMSYNKEYEKEYNMKYVNE